MGGTDSKNKLKAINDVINYVTVVVHGIGRDLGCGRAWGRRGTALVATRNARQIEVRWDLSDESGSESI